MIIYRLADGSAWQKNTLEKNTLTTMRFEDRPGKTRPKTETDTTLTRNDVLDSFSAAPNPSASTVFLDKKAREGLAATPELASIEQKEISMV